MVDTKPHDPVISADEALQRLIDGNERFLREEPRSPRFQKDILLNLAKEQKPYATILGCSDSEGSPGVDIRRRLRRDFLWCASPVTRPQRKSWEAFKYGRSPPAHVAFRGFGA